MKNKLLGVINRLHNGLKRISPKVKYQPGDGLEYWREQIFIRVISAAILFIAPLVIILILIAIVMKEWAGLFFVSLAYLSGLVSTFGRRISLRNRIIIFLITLYSLGLILQVMNGPVDNGLVLLFFFPIMTAVLLNIRLAVYAVGLNFITILILGILLMTGTLQNSGMSIYPPQRWVGVSIGFMPLNMIATLSISVLLKGLVSGFETSKEADNALKQSEARYRAIIEQQIELIDRWTPDGTITFANDALCQFYHRTPQELLGTSIIDLAPEIETERLKEHIRSFSTEKPTANYITSRPDASGELRWMEWHDAAIFDENGSITEFQSIGRDITDQKRAEEKLKQSEARYRAVVEDQMELIDRMLPDTTIIFCNVAYARFFNKTPAELIGCKLSDLLPPEELTRIQKFISKLTPENPVFNASHIEVNYLGEDRWFKWVDRGIFDSEGNLVEVQGIGHDIHDQVLAQQALAESEARYRAVVEDQAELICRMLPDGTILFTNEAYARFFGKQPEDLIHTNLRTLTDEEDYLSLIRGFNTINPRNPVFLNTHLESSVNGEKRWFTWTNRGIFDENGTLTEIQALGQDVHEQFLAEEALRESEARYRAIVEGQTEPVSRWTPDFLLTFVNDAYCKLFAKTREELIGRTFLSLIPKEDWEIIKNSTTTLDEENKQSIHINRVITAQGIRWLQWSVNVIQADDGTVIEYQSVGHDITEQKHTQQKLQETLFEQIKLTEANRELAKRLEGLYLADVDRHEAQLSHLAVELHDDVLNALAVVSANLDPEETPNHVIEAYEQAIHRTREIVNGLRTTMLNYGLYIGLETLADEFSDQYPQGPIFYVDVPRTDIRYDPNVELHLFRIVQEACNNAIKHANPTEIHIRGQMDSSRVVLEVLDDGSGFAAENILDLPELLRQQHFGLAGMFERAELIHGDLDINSAPHQGCRVRVHWQNLDGDQ